MQDGSEKNLDWIAERIESITGTPPRGRPRIVRDTTNYMSIDRDQVIELQGEYYLVRRNEQEGRFGLDGQPKFWVKRTLSLQNGGTYVLKLVFHEEFSARVGTLNIKCKRSEEKEGKVLDLVRGDRRFMQGCTSRDACGNLVRVIGYIQGADLLNHLWELEGTHEHYFHQEFPAVLARVTNAFEGISRLHAAGLCHGDIRSDHVLVERKTGEYRWIDFDLQQDYSDFDVWSVGNVLGYAVAKGFVTFQRIAKEQGGLPASLTAQDASVFHPHRIMNMAKVFPYIPDRLNRILCRFSAGSEVFYDTVDQLIADLREFADQMNWPSGTEDP